MGRPLSYFPALYELLGEEPGEWWVLATFDSLTGARDAKSRIRRGVIRVPHGGWEFRDMKNGDGTSELWVRRHDGRKQA